MSSPYTNLVIAKFSILQGKLKEAEEFFAAALPATRNYKGCLDIQVVIDEAKNIIIILQDWATLDDHTDYVAWRMSTGLATTLDNFCVGGIKGLDVQKPLTRVSEPNAPDQGDFFRAQLGKKVIATFDVQESKMSQAEDLFRAVLGDTRAYKGCLGVSVYKDEAKNQVVLLQSWQEYADHSAYLKWRLDNGLADKLVPIFEGGLQALSVNKPLSPSAA
jgi:quinol monooxygenase YgiN